MIQIDDIIEVYGIQYRCWFIEIIEEETYVHLINDNNGICVLLEDIKNNLI